MDTTEHVYLVAITIEGPETMTSEESQKALMGLLPTPYGASWDNMQVSSWWIAEDDRLDGSDNDSAVFVHPGLQHSAGLLLHAADMTSEYNVKEQKK